MPIPESAHVLRIPTREDYVGGRRRPGAAQTEHSCRMTASPIIAQSRIAATGLAMTTLVMRRFGAMLVVFGFLAAGAGVIEAGLRAPPALPERIVFTSDPGGRLPGRVEVAQALTVEAGRAIGPLLR